MDCSYSTTCTDCTWTVLHVVTRGLHQGESYKIQSFTNAYFLFKTGLRLFFSERSLRQIQSVVNSKLLFIFNEKNRYHYVDLFLFYWMKLTQIYLWPLSYVFDPTHNFDAQNNQSLIKNYDGNFTSNYVINFAFSKYLNTVMLLILLTF